MDVEKKQLLNKIYNKFDELFISEIRKMIEEVDEYKNNDYVKEILILYKSSLQSLLLALKIYDNHDLVNATCILRSSFENLLCALAMSVDEETLAQYKYRDSNVYKEALKIKYRKIQQKNPKYKPPKIKKNDYKLNPRNVRETVIDHHSILLPGFFDVQIDNPKEDLNEFYRYLCSLVHPSIVKTCVYKMQENYIELKNVEILFKVNIYYLGLMILSSHKYLFKKNINVQFDLLSLTILLSFSQVEEIKNMKKVFNKYSDYLYFNVNQHCISKQKEKIKELEKNIKSIKNNEELKDVMISKFKEIIAFYNILEI